MRRLSVLRLLVSGPLLLSCAQQQAPTTTVADVRDVHSYARAEEARVTHVALDLVPDFQAKRIGGTARLAIDRAEGADSIILDIDELAIRRVTDAAGDTLAFRVGPDNAVLG